MTTSPVDRTAQEKSDALQLDMASRGCVSGTLDEWPCLLAALRRAGVPAEKCWSAAQARKAAREVLGVPDWEFAVPMPCPCARHA